ncbi:hypothetical protein QR680_018511 [Steinernema hermaphroditum]|uniref:non-specific serine/threonine protein kinase n=1 Tax=Steinernema hermaphroditum TaxID=289476 RepID=A0AA39HI64_9BILA|nr:hypothetical protein QR680_018511 [Steinernema hermaphroditum]
MATEGSDTDAPLKFKAGQKFGKWKVVQKLDEGGFGQVYKVEKMGATGVFAALKAESNEIEGGSAIKLEISVLMLLNRNGAKPHVPEVYHSAKRKKYCYMIVTLLGENLRSLRMSCPNEHVSPQAWSRLGIQCLYSIKLLHDVGYVHRDIKPANFVMGHDSDADRARIVHILDFGLARAFASLKGSRWIARRARGSAEFRGTARYCSPSVHERKEQGRKDDIWSLLYMLIELHCGLPWQKERDKYKLEVKKMNISDADLLKNFPREMHPIVPHLREMHYYSRPDYAMIYECFVRLMKRLKVTYDQPFDWETEEQVSKIIKRRTKTPEYENPAAFFASDPVKINSAPSKDQTTEIGGQTVDDNQELITKTVGAMNVESASRAGSNKVNKV